MNFLSRILFVVSLPWSIAAEAFAEAPADAAPLPPNDAYVTVSDDGHLELDGERVRFWGIIGAYTRDYRWQGLDPSDPPETRQAKLNKRYRDLDAAADRIQALGFNLLRLWHSPTLKEDFEAGDGSRDDLMAYFLNALYERDIRVWNSAINRGTVGPGDVDVIDDPSTADAWSQAIEEMVERRIGKAWWVPEGRVGYTVARIWDPRLRAISIRNRQAYCNWVNPYRGIRWGDDPHMVVWELSNEQWWIRHMVHGAWQELPLFFQRSLLVR